MRAPCQLRSAARAASIAGNSSAPIASSVSSKSRPKPVTRPTPQPSTTRPEGLKSGLDAPCPRSGVFGSEIRDKIQR